MKSCCAGFAFTDKAMIKRLQTLVLSELRMQLGVVQVRTNVSNDRCGQGEY